jgi:hypothetical protein
MLSTPSDTLGTVTAEMEAPEINATGPPKKKIALHETK